MYVLKLENGTSAAIAGIAASGEGFLPADRCVFNTAYDSTSGNYQVDQADFYPGNAAAIAIDSASCTLTLGFIGKSGRFVAMTAPNTFS